MANRNSNKESGSKPGDFSTVSGTRECGPAEYEKDSNHGQKLQNPANGTQLEDECHVYDCITDKLTHRNTSNPYENMRQAHSAAGEPKSAKERPEQMNVSYEPLKKSGLGRKSSVRRGSRCTPWLRTHRVCLLLSLVVIGTNVAAFIAYTFYSRTVTGGCTEEMRVRSDDNAELMQALESINASLRQGLNELEARINDNKNVKIMQALEDIETGLNALDGRIRELHGSAMQGAEPSSTNPVAPTTRKTTGCPSGFDSIPEAGGCYKIVFQALNWTQSQARCPQLDCRAHLAVITSVQQNSAIVNYLRMFNETTPCKKFNDRQAYYTSGQRVIDGDCDTPIVWKPAPFTTLPLTYSDWAGYQPDCYGPYKESCMIYPESYSYRWNDIPCGTKTCPLCQIDP